MGEEDWIVCEGSPDPGEGSGEEGEGHRWLCGKWRGLLGVNQMQVLLRCPQVFLGIVLLRRWES